LTAFPDVVRTVLEEGGPVEVAFVPDDGVAVASEHGVRAVDEPKVAECCPEYEDEFSGDAHVVYEDLGDSTVRKAMNWRDRNVTIEVEDARTHRIVDEDTTDLVESVFAERERADVTEASTGEIDEQTLERLKELGYR